MLTLSIVLTLLAVSQSPTPESPKKISGRIVDHGGEPVASLRVRLVEPASAALGPWGQAVCNGESQEWLDFVVQDTRASLVGEFELTSNIIGTALVVVGEGSPGAPMFARGFTVLPTSHLTIQLPPLVTAKGRVVDSQGNGMHATIMVGRETFLGAAILLDSAVETEADGRFSISAFASDETRVVVKSRGCEPAVLSIEKLSASPEVELRSRQPTSISVSADGVGLDSYDTVLLSRNVVTRELEQVNGVCHTVHRTDNGLVEVLIACNEEIHVMIEAPGRAPTLVGPLVPSNRLMRLEAKLVDGRSVGGVVTDVATGMPIGGVDITLRHGNYISKEAFGRLSHRSGVSSRDGEFLIGNLMQGVYYVHAEADGFLSKTHGPVDIPPSADVLGLSISLSRGARVRGHLVNCADAVLVLQPIELSAPRFRDDEEGLVRMPVVVEPGAKGDFDTRVHPGTYSVLLGVRYELSDGTPGVEWPDTNGPRASFGVGETVTLRVLRRDDNALDVMDLSRASGR